MPLVISSTLRFLKHRVRYKYAASMMIRMTITITKTPITADVAVLSVATGAPGLVQVTLFSFSTYPDMQLHV